MEAEDYVSYGNLAKKLQRFFATTHGGIKNYGCVYSLNGTLRENGKFHPSGLVAANAAASHAIFVDKFKHLVPTDIKRALEPQLSTWPLSPKLKIDFEFWENG